MTIEIEHEDGDTTIVVPQKNGNIMTILPNGPMTYEVYYPGNNIIETEIQLWSEEHGNQMCKLHPHTYKRRSFYD